METIMKRIKNLAKKTIPLLLALSMLATSVSVNAAEGDTEYTSVKVEQVAVVDKAEEIEIKSKPTEDNIFAAHRLIITSEEDMEFRESSVLTNAIKSVTRFEDKYIVEYASVDATKDAYEKYTSLGYEVEIDAAIDTPDDVENKDKKG